ncbi:CYTH domain-containing protein [Marinobacter zhejiangensis]|uniref:CYTH domain-containing protein n=1 Tax=Marinobacter zhejiangensis TaxID=488535 RepID=A0A1I4SDA4_9GAMM|nr:CYTH domain-containing protein [Marinobacter zhejiangensis]SFM62445.1 CYTH domain-containing protein [Marinobacter zhejiangensis]
MAQELEIKLTLSRESSRQAYEWLLDQEGASPGARKQLINTYFDTGEADLNRRRAALRIRQAGECFIQTLKTQGEFVNGAHRRQEWEWEVPSADLDFSLLAKTSLANDLDLGQLGPVFETNFERQVVMLDDGEAVIECAFDTGEIRSGRQSVPLCELEFELKSGDEARLLVWARKLAEQVPFFINLISKAEQGYHLAGIHEPEPLPADADAVTRFFHGVSVLWLNGEVTSELSAAMGELESKLEGNTVRAAGSPGDVNLLDDLKANPVPMQVQGLGRLQLALLGC